MKREQLEDYRSKKGEIKELEYRLQHLGEGDSMVGNDVIFDYRSGFPIPQSVVGTDWDKVTRTENRCKSRIQKLKTECDEIEQFVEDIEDSVMRRIIRMYFIDGMSQENVAKSVGYSRGRVSQKINDFLKD